MFLNFKYWQDAEIEKVRKNYADKRRAIKDEAFFAGFSGNSGKDATMQDIDSRYNATYKQEEAAVKAIQTKAEQMDAEREKRLEAERKEQVRKNQATIYDNRYGR